MRTQVMHDSVRGVPWLEYLPADSSRPLRKDLEGFPFTIGRSETSQLRIESSRVSREHAVILHDSQVHSIRDLGSTNGTFLNGERVAESPLVDGDVLMIADVEITFHAALPNGASQRTVTQVMGAAPHESRVTGRDFVSQVRRLHESLTQRSVTTLFRPIVELRNGEVFGYRVTPTDEDAGRLASRTERLLYAAECRLTERFYELHRLLAAEQAVQLQDSGYLLFPLQTAEVGGEWLPQSLTRLQQVLGDRQRMGVSIPESAACDIPYFRDFVRRLRDLGILCVYGGFHGGAAQVANWKPIAPDIVELSAALVRSLPRSSGGQRQVQGIIRAARDLGADVVATGVSGDAEVEILRELNCRLVSGDRYGRPLPIAALVNSGAT